jgi:hypothetical protein
MANLSVISNLLNCGVSDAQGLGLAHCKFNFNDMAGGATLFLNRGTELPSDFTLASLRALQVAGKLKVASNPFSVEIQNADDQKETSSGGVTAVATKGLYGFMFKYVNGLLFDTALASLNSQNAYDVVLIDSSGNALFATSKSGKRTGFSAGMVNAMMIDFASGATTTKTGVEFQFTNREQMDNGKTFINSDEIDFSLLELNGVNQLQVTLAAPATGATTVTGKIVSKYDGTLTSTEITEAELTVTGATASAATVAANGDLSITVDALSAGDVISVQITGVFEDTEGVLFKSNTATAVTIA